MTRHDWNHYCNQTGESYGKPNELTGNALFARECRDTPLTAEAIMALVWNNIEYFGDSYYSDITTPIQWRVEEYYDSMQTPASGHAQIRPQDSP